MQKQESHGYQDMMSVNKWNVTFLVCVCDNAALSVAVIVRVMASGGLRRGQGGGSLCEFFTTYSLGLCGQEEVQGRACCLQQHCKMWNAKDQILVYDVSAYWALLVS
jgi:hypothetical protein